MVVKPPTAPQNLTITSATFSFTTPQYLGGSNILRYEVDIQDPTSGVWYMFSHINVKYLSSEPELPDKPFGELGGEYKFRVYSVNLTGRGDFAEQIIELTGQSSS